MQRVELHLKNDERTRVEAMCSSGFNQVRLLQRAQILLALDKGIQDQQIADVLNIERTRIWRTRKRYLTGGLEAALYDLARPGWPTKQKLLPLPVVNRLQDSRAGVCLY
jgi:cation diffusion facilitator CzcD-associated flavoprotein CzcO